MYLKYYGLKKGPFDITPDPEFLFLSPSHKEALGSIIYGIEKRKGFISIVGEVGTGKTTIIRSYLENTNREILKPIYIFNSNISFNELLVLICKELCLKYDKLKSYELLNFIQELLIENYKSGINHVLIIDEAQNMPIETLEMMRMLSNLETSKEKLVQIILIGQPELEYKLNSIELRQLKQRLALKAIIKPLKDKECYDYIKHRLLLVCKNYKTVFSDRSIKKIIKYSKGIPRTVNVLCDNCLIAGYGSNIKPVNSKIVKCVIKEYNQKSYDYFKNSFAHYVSILVIVFVALIYGGRLYLNKYDKSTKIEKNTSLSEYAYASVVANEANNELEVNNKVNIINDNNETTKESTFVQKNTNIITDKIEHNELSKEIIYKEEFDKSIKSFDSSLVRVVKRGDYLTKMCVEVYGYTNEKIIHWVWMNNPWISNVNLLSVGDVIIFPQLENKYIR